MSAPAIQSVLTRSGPACTVLVGLCLAHCLLYLSNDVDDAYINYRYSRSIARGDGVTFNPGERVEGISAPAWVLMGAVPLALGATDPHRVMQGIGIAAACATVALLFVLSRRLFDGAAPGWAWVAPLWFLAQPRTAFWACSGMDATFYAFVVSLAVFVWLREGLGWRLGLCIGVGALTRPEAPWLFGVLVLLTPLRGAKAAETGRRLLATGAAAALVFGPWLAFRVLYFGEFLPNTYFAKRMTLENGLGSGWIYLRGYLAASGGAPVLAAALALALRRAPFGRLGLVWVLGAAAVLRIGGDWMPQHRFLLHLLGIESLVVAGALQGLVEWLGRRRVPLAAALPVLLLVPWLGLEAERSRRLVRAMDAARPTLQARCRILGEMIRTRPDVRRVALLDIGKIGYFADVPITDLVGLTDPVIARSPGTHFFKVYDPAYVLDQSPEIIVLGATGDVQREGQGGRVRLDVGSLTDVERRLYLHPRFQREYSHEGAVSRAEPPGPRTGYYHLFVRRNARR